MKILQELTAVRLLQLKAIKFQPKNPFVWANGWTAPMYCDDRKVLSYPKMRDFIRLELARVISEMYPDADIIAGVATNAIGDTGCYREDVVKGTLRASHAIHRLVCQEGTHLKVYLP